MNRQVLLHRRPEPLPGPDDFELITAPVPEPADGQLLVRQRWLSIDPAMRNWVSAAPGRGTPVALGEVMRSITLGEVVSSRHPSYAVGQLIVGQQGWQDFALSDGSDITRAVPPDTRPLQAALGVLGHIGITAHIGMLGIGRPEAGETVLVSTAAGAVGSIAGQLARLAGARVVGLTGSLEKVRTCLEVFGFDACLDYRSAPDLVTALQPLCPDGIDVYFDNVGGAMLDAALELANPLARVPLCGTLSIPPGTTPVGPRPERRLLDRRVLVQGFVAGDHVKRYEEILGFLGQHVRAGRLRTVDDVTDGLENAPKALARVLAGGNVGKALVRVVADEQSVGV